MNNGGFKESIIVMEGTKTSRFDNVTVLDNGDAFDEDEALSFKAGTWLYFNEWQKMIKPIKDRAVELAVKYAKEKYKGDK